MEVYLIRHPKPARCEGLCYGRNECRTHAGLIRVALAGARDVGAKLLIDAPFGSVHRGDVDALEAGAP
jgi:hypothetical protein